MPSPKKPQVKRVVLAYSGGLDTSIILKWLQTEYGCEVITFTADLGQGEELSRRARRRTARRQAARTSSSRTCARNSCATSSSRCSAPMRSTRANISWAPRSRGRSSPSAWSRSPIKSAPTRSPMARPARATTRCASSCRPTRWTPTSRSSRPGANGSSPPAMRFSPSPNSTRSRSPRTSGRSAVFGRRQPPACVFGGQGAGGPGAGDACLRLFAHLRSGGRARQADRGRDRVREGRSGRDRRQGDEPGDAAHRLEQARPRQWNRPARSRREPIRRHEVARHVRDARRHDPARGAPGDRIDHPRPRRRASQGRTDAQIRRAHLQRLLVLARARDLAGLDRQEPGDGRRPGAAQTLQGRRLT